MIDIINSQKITEFLNDGLKNKIKIDVLEKVTSTNTVAKERASECEEGFVVIAGEQTAGRGRMGRSFFSPGDSGVYISVVLKPKIKPEDAVQITTASAVAVCKALEKLGVNESKIKWVNDVYLDNRKICGILTESSFNSRCGNLDFIILGVGVNIYEAPQGFPDEIKNIAGAVFSERKEDLRNKFIAEFLNEFFCFYENLCSKNHLKEYKKKSFVLGREINIIQGESVRRGKAIDIDENCNLVVELPDGKIEKLYSGEISIRLK